MTYQAIVEKKVKKYKRRLSRVESQSVFYRDASKMNAQAGRVQVSEVQHIQANYYDRQVKRTKELIEDLSEIIELSKNF